MSNLFKEKAYKLLYQLYRSLYSNILHRAQNVHEYGKEDGVKHKDFVRTIVEVDKYDYCGIQRKTDAELVKTIEYLLDDTQPVK